MLSCKPMSTMVTMTRINIVGIRIINIIITIITTNACLDHTKTRMALNPKSTSAGPNNINMKYSKSRPTYSATSERLIWGLLDLDFGIRVRRDSLRFGLT